MVDQPDWSILKGVLCKNYILLINASSYDKRQKLFIIATPLMDRRELSMQAVGETVAVPMMYVCYVVQYAEPFCCCEVPISIARCNAPV